MNTPTDCKPPLIFPSQPLKPNKTFLKSAEEPLDRLVELKSQISRSRIRPARVAWDSMRLVCDASFAAAIQWPSPQHHPSTPHLAPRRPPASLFIPPNSAPPFSKQKPVEDCWAVLQRSSSPITHLPEVILSLSRDNRGESDTKWRLIGPGDEQLSKSCKKPQFSEKRKKSNVFLTFVFLSLLFLLFLSFFLFSFYFF